MKHIMYALAFMLCCAEAIAQPPKLSKEEFRSKQQAFITAQAKLTQKEAEQFFPLYFELQDKKEVCNREAWQKIKKGKKENLADAEYAQLNEEVIRSRITSDNLDLEYLHKYKAFLSAKKIFDILRAEMRFHRELLKPHKRP